MENQNHQNILSLAVTEEQKLAIQAFFSHNDWDFNEIASSSTSSNFHLEDNTENNVIATDGIEHPGQSGSDQQSASAGHDINDKDMCQDCFCSPCVTQNRESWLGVGQRAHVRNSGIRKLKYKLFWRMMQDRGAWSIPQYLRKKCRLLNRDRVDETVVIVRREVIPDCVLKLVRELYPNPKSKPYMGHRWKLSFLPDPKDGSLYALGDGMNGIKKLPFTIPQLVSASPCKSNEGILYTGHKKDVWIAVDPVTGEKIRTLSMDGTQKVCPSDAENVMYIGRSEYTITMFDSKTGHKRWNATFTDYSTNVANKDSKDYDYKHLSSSSNGMSVTLDSKTGEIKWLNNYNSPVVAMYTLSPDGLQKVPFYTFAPETLEHLTGKLTSRLWKEKFLKHGDQEVFYPTLYVGEYEHGFYALGSLVDETTVAVAPKNQGPLLLEGPKLPPKKGASREETSTASTKRREHSYMMLGHHEIPEESSNKMSPALAITDKSNNVIFPNIDPVPETIKPNITTTVDHGIYQYVDVKGKCPVCSTKHWVETTFQMV
ncbi:ERN1 [Mytilus coruscus]|uniref:ERN1 n=1 Tax=Mytilus coruscus TaxID=42192 RepID=A0A6J8AXM2_MYTCO|nr:ERN1 [Mytilus coruscus]